MHAVAGIDLFGKDMIFRLIAFVLALVVHEFGHAFVALLVGDQTPKQQGRVTLNPLAHLDVVGLLIIFIAPFGWAKPVVFDPRNIKINKRLGIILIALAGPMMNILFFLLSVGLFSLATQSQSLFWTTALGSFTLNLLNWLIAVNITLAVFNLIPIPPLDGWQILRSLLPKRLYFKLNQFERVGPFLLILFIITPIGQSAFQSLVQTVVSWFGMA